MARMRKNANEPTSNTHRASTNASNVGSLYERSEYVKSIIIGKAGLRDPVITMYYSTTSGVTFSDKDNFLDYMHNVISTIACVRADLSSNSKLREFNDFEIKFSNQTSAYQAEDGNNLVLEVTPNGFSNAQECKKSGDALLKVLLGRGGVNAFTRCLTLKTLRDVIIPVSPPAIEPMPQRQAVPQFITLFDLQKYPTERFEPYDNARATRPNIRIRIESKGLYDKLSRNAYVFLDFVINFFRTQKGLFKSKLEYVKLTFNATQDKLISVKLGRTEDESELIKTQFEVTLKSPSSLSNSESMVLAVVELCALINERIDPSMDCNYEKLVELAPKNEDIFILEASLFTEAIIYVAETDDPEAVQDRTEDTAAQTIEIAQDVVEAADSAPQNEALQELAEVVSEAAESAAVVAEEAVAITEEAAEEQQSLPLESEEVSSTPARRPRARRTPTPSASTTDIETSSLFNNVDIFYFTQNVKPKLSNVEDFTLEIDSLDPATSTHIGTLSNPQKSAIETFVKELHRKTQKFINSDMYTSSANFVFVPINVTKSKYLGCHVVSSASTTDDLFKKMSEDLGGLPITLVFGISIRDINDLADPKVKQKLTTQFAKGLVQLFDRTDSDFDLDYYEVLDEMGR
jgi:hypothetical protein